MYNVCNTGVNNRQGGCSYGYWNGCGQRVCRDCCGNLIVYNRTACGCCQQLCGNGTGNDTTQQNNGNTGTNGNGVFRCVTFCGYGNNGVQPRSGGNCGLSYYARQYGLTCDDNAECAYNYTND